MTKTDIRKKFRQQRTELSAALKDKWEDLILIQFQTLHLDIPDAVMTYSPIEAMNEYNPILLEEYCFFKNPNVTLVYPVGDRENKTINPVAVKEDTVFDLNEYDIEEPLNGTPVAANSIGLIIVPLIAFDETGHRVGYGKGYYDRFLADCSSDALKIGISFFPPEVIDDVNEFDRPLDYCITPEAIFQFK